MNRMMNLAHKAYIALRPPSPEETKKSSNERAAIPSSLKHTKRVLLLDDDIHLLAVMDEINESKLLNMHLLTCDTMREAELMIDATGEKCPFDLLLFDIKLANGCGIDLYERVKKKYPDLHVAFLTGHATDPVRKRIAKIGSARVIEKTVDTIQKEWLIDLLKKEGIKERL